MQKKKLYQIECKKKTLPNRMQKKKKNFTK